MKALGLLSGGLDSSLAVKMIKDQGIEVIALKFTSPFCNCDSGGKCHAPVLAKELGIRLITIAKDEDYLDIVRNPRFGRGSGMNPCLDCRIYMLEHAKKIAEDIDAKFIFTGEVLGQRPMSQHRRAMDLIEHEVGLEGKILRPLSAGLMPPTEAELNGWVDREKLLSISGRSRKPQIKLADEIGLADYPCPAGGCLLTSKEFAVRLKDHIDHHPGRITWNDIALLKLGRHLRISGRKLIIGRDERENRDLLRFAGDSFLLLEPAAIPGPVALMERGDLSIIPEAASIVARYSDNNGEPVMIKSADGPSLLAGPCDETKIDMYRISDDQARTVPPLTR